MITANGYTKDKSIQPEGIVVTFGKEMIEQQGGLKCFLKSFENTMKDPDEDRYWMHKCKNKPVHDVTYIYIIVHGRIYYRCQFGGHFHFDTIGYSADGKQKVIDWPGIVITGPMIKAPIKIKRKGFQGFRYCTKLF